ncbi:MAG: cyclic pyranopterin monophosphate synthase MoaC [Solibacterales bacterium]|nr:cyclic pyranopterin monophosphate synthase MoaC [Bryobacterales bacterium]|tara:strand:- start:32400 stop:32876 length:477 start_codon:yes stop_codon:yes gene_type:complete
MSQLSHFDNNTGAVRMVDVSDKPNTQRTARAHALVKLSPSVIGEIPKNPKGNPLEVARIAGISAAKRTSELIPLCHPLLLHSIDVQISLVEEGVNIETTVITTGPTGAEMEALTAASVAALTVYDMTKSLDKAIEISEIYLLEKTGGKSGTYRRPASL